MKSKMFLLLLSVLFISETYSQCNITVHNVSNYTPFAIDSLYESNGLRNGPSYNDATMFFPLNGNKSLKSIVLVPGYQAAQKSVIAWARYFASRGYISMTIGTNSLNDYPSVRALALIDGMETVRQENNRINSPLFHKIDTSSIAVGGWSMGGGGAQLAAKMDRRIKAVLAIAPWLDPRTLTQNDLNHSAPVLILSGQIDPTAPPALYANVQYDYTPKSTPKLIFEISGGNHHTPLYPNTGNGDVGNVAYAWLKLFLDDNHCYCNLLGVDSLNQNSTASKYQTNLDCKTTSVFDTENSNLPYGYLLFQNYPNPFNPVTKIKYSIPNSSRVNLKVYDMLGNEVSTLVNQFKNAGEYEIEFNADYLPSGVYIYRMISGNVVKAKKLLIMK